MQILMRLNLIGGTSKALDYAKFECPENTFNRKLIKIVETMGMKVCVLQQYLNSPTAILLH